MLKSHFSLQTVVSWRSRLQIIVSDVCFVFVRLDVRKAAMTLLIDALPPVAASISQPAVKSLLRVLLSATHTNDVSHDHHHHHYHTIFKVA